MTRLLSLLWAIFRPAATYEIDNARLLLALKARERSKQ